MFVYCASSADPLTCPVLTLICGVHELLARFLIMVSSIASVPAVRTTTVKGLGARRPLPSDVYEHPGVWYKLEAASPANFS
jgi:hypothetical protein